MPSVNIREIDRTGSETLEYLNYTVLVPGIAIKHKGEESGDPDVLFGGLLTSVEDFNKEFVPDQGQEKYKKDLGFLSAYEYVSMGLSVYYMPVYDIPAIIGEPGSKPKYVKYNDPETGEKSWTAADLFKKFEDKGLYDLRFITIGGLYLFDNDTASIEAMRCAGNRGDAVALLDVPESDGGETSDKRLTTSSLIDTWVQNTFGTIVTTKIPKAKRNGVSWSKDNPTETYGRYGAIYAPICVAELPLLVLDEDEESGAEESGALIPEYSAKLAMPASFFTITSFAKQMNTFPEWFATAGSVRGTLAFNGVLPVIKFGDADVSKLQKRTDTVTGHIATNVICNVRPYGNIIWGNRTMHPLSRPEGLSEAAVQLQASSFLNIRELCITLKKTLYRASRRFTFDPNTDVLWYNFRAAIMPLLDRMKANQGIRGYQIIQVPTTKKALLVARIIISPIEATEDFDLTVELADSVDITE